jgi:signal transduction histidine kinase
VKFFWIVSILLLGPGLGSAVRASAVRFRTVETTYRAETSRPQKTIDGVDANPDQGWSVAPEVAKPQAAVFTARQAVVAERLRISLCFLSGVHNAHFRKFVISGTSDPNPSLSGNWEPLAPWQVYSTGTKLEVLEGSRMRSSGDAFNTVFVVEILGFPRRLTGLRVDVLTTDQAQRDQPEVGGSEQGDFTLTEFRVEAFDAETTNAALGRPAKASHKNWGGFRPEFLTDGLAATFTHPRAPNLGEEFYFEIDFDRVISLDHVALRNRGDGMVPERLSRITLKLYESAPEAESQPVWEGRDRADGSYPDPGEVDVVRAGQGKGSFRGRYLRISSDSPIGYSPQLAEVEAYESLAPELAAVRADGVQLEVAAQTRPPQGTRWLAFSMNPSIPGLPAGIPLRWRLRGYHQEWKAVSSDRLAEVACPPPGTYTFEAQLGHTDGLWNERILQCVIVVPKPWWQWRWVQFAAAAGLAAGVAWTVRFVARRRLARQVAELERSRGLDAERARIARDMHDVVGSRLTQLTVLHEIFSAEHALGPEAAGSLHRLNATAREAVAALDEVVWAINPRNDTLANVADYLCHCATEYFRPLEIACRLDAPADWAPLQVRAQIRHQILLAFKEALQNVLKHAAATEVTLTLRFEAPEMVVFLEDNGRGIPKDPAGTEKDGLSNMRERLQSVGGICRVSPRTEGGTCVEMRVKI